MKSTTKTLLFAIAMLWQFTTQAQPKLSSFSSAEATIFMDFDGHRVVHPFWNGGQPLNCAPAQITDAQITEIFHRVSEDFRPFNVNITTDSTVFLNAPLNKRVRIIVTPTSSWYTNVGGISYIGSFTWGDDTPGFVFSDRLQNKTKYIAECITHESGHTVGLSHQSSYNQGCELIEPYATGTGSGETGWAPVMGNSYYRNMTGWNDGPTPYGCSLTQDNLTIITSQNGFDYREDDHDDEMNENATWVNEISFNKGGIISTNTDKDVFAYNLTHDAAVHFEAKPFGLNNTTDGANLDIKIELFDSERRLMGTYNPQNRLDVSIDTSLNAGLYFLVVSGTGNSNISNYGSLGSYTILGTRGVLPIRDVTLRGFKIGNQHKLVWNIVSDEPIESQILERSVDGINFEAIARFNGEQRSFRYTPDKTGNLYYRIKATSVIAQNATSNTLTLRAENDKIFEVTTLVNSHIRIRTNSTTNYDYSITDVSGRTIARGNAKGETRFLSVQNLPTGIYFLQLFGENGRQTERIIKQ